MLTQITESKARKTRLTFNISILGSVVYADERILWAKLPGRWVSVWI